MKIYNIIKSLEARGYKFNLESNEKINVTLQDGYSKPDPEEVIPLFDKLKENKSKVIQILKNREMLSPVPDWFVMKSKLLDGEKILIRKNSSVKIPSKYRSIESYTFEEGRSLIKDDTSPDELKTIHKVRKELNGTLILVNPEVVKK